MPQYFDIKPLPAPPRVAPTQPTEPQMALHPRTFAAPAVAKPKFPPHFKLLGSMGVVIGLTLLAFGLFTKPPASAPASAAPSAASVPALPTAPTAETKQSPWRLSVPSIGVDATIQEVGLTREGNMGVPSNYTDVGWLKTGPRLGQPGNSVLSGHLNGGPNVPAVFQNLHKLKTGDFIYVKDNDKHTEQRFRVIGSQSYSVTEAPLDKIFGGTQATHLNLITCSGSWDKTKKDYDQRLVVFTELAQP